MISNYLLESNQESAQDFESKLLLSKLKSLNEHLSALIQKKIRIDLEIKRTRRKLSKLKQQSKTYVKTRVEIEGFDYDLFTPEDLIPLQESVGEEAFKKLIKLDSEVERAEKLETDYADLPLYEDN